jgi:hypothetical protein
MYFGSHSHADIKAGQEGQLNRYCMTSRNIRHYKEMTGMHNEIRRMKEETEKETLSDH